MNKKLFINKTDELKKNIDSALSKTKNIHLKKKVIDKSFSSVLTRVATELLAGLIVGAGLGIMLDNWMETKPLFMIICFLIGGFAGIYNLWRQVAGHGLKIGYFNNIKKD
tara:strand:- start:1009 stop:1338 length:330 start_codon:yes stop_codon:yes gene_type:complete